MESSLFLSLLHPYSISVPKTKYQTCLYYALMNHLTFQLMPRKFLVSYDPHDKSTQSRDPVRHLLYLQADEAHFVHDEASSNASFRLARVGGTRFRHHTIIDLLRALSRRAQTQNQVFLIIGDSTQRWVVFYLLFLRGRREGFTPSLRQSCMYTHMNCYCSFFILFQVLERCTDTFGESKWCVLYSSVWRKIRRWFPWIHCEGWKCVKVLYYKRPFPVQRFSRGYATNGLFRAYSFWKLCIWNLHWSFRVVHFNVFYKSTVGQRAIFITIRIKLMEQPFENKWAEQLG